MNLYQHTKNQAISSSYSRDTVDRKILQSDWPRTFLLISQESDFSQAQDLYRDVVNNINFRYTTNSEEIKDQISKLIKKTLILAHFLFHIWGKMFLKEICLSGKISYGFLRQ